MILLKLTVVPFIILVVSHATKIWGPFVGGLLSGVPIIAAPITLFLAIEYGDEFALTSAKATLLGVVALSSFCFVYSWCSTKFGWCFSLIISWFVYFVLSYFISFVSINPNISIFIAVGVLFLLRYSLPKTTPITESLSISNNQILARVVSSAVLVVIVTRFALYLGPNLSGIFSAFPLAATILALFTHAFYSSNQTVILIKGLMLGTFSLCAFYYCLSVSSEWLGFYQAFFVSIGAVIVLQVFSLNLHRKKANKAKH